MVRFVVEQFEPTIFAVIDLAEANTEALVKTRALAQGYADALNKRPVSVDEVAHHYESDGTRTGCSRCDQCKTAAIHDCRWADWNISPP